MEALSHDQWSQRAEAHRARLAPYIGPHLERRRSGIVNPIHDFLFTYYAFRPGQLLRWHPGFSLEEPSSSVEPVETPYVAERVGRIAQLHRLLTATASRPGNFGCFGMHEWAMVYRADETRHAVPLRLGRASTDAVVERHRIACSHFDAFRFFTPPARGLNLLQPSAADRPDFEQPACLHGGMDLYKHAFRLSPMICSDLVADAFELAWDIRIADMRAAPYDMSGWTLDPTGEPWTPIPVETPEGKAEYVALQRSFAERGAPLRAALIAECERLLAAVSAVGGTVEPWTSGSAS